MTSNDLVTNGFILDLPQTIAWTVIFFVNPLVDRFHGNELHEKWHALWNSIRLWREWRAITICDLAIISALFLFLDFKL